MSILGLGTDIVAVDRIRRLLDQHGERFLTRCFRGAELDHLTGPAADHAPAVAARWAAKEAFLKALGRDVRHVPYADIEVVRSSAGPVSIRAHGAAEAVLGAVGAGRPVDILLSMSHGRDQAIAVVVIQAM